MSGPTTTQLFSKAVGASSELALAGGGSSAVKIFLILTALSFGTALVLSVMLLVFSFCVFLSARLLLARRGTR